MYIYKSLMITPLYKGLFGVMLKLSLSSSLEFQLVGGKPVGYLQSMVNLPLGSPRTNSFSSPSRGFVPGSSAFKSPTLTTEPRCLHSYTVLSRNSCLIGFNITDICVLQVVRKIILEDMLLCGRKGNLNSLEQVQTEKLCELG